MKNAKQLLVIFSLMISTISCSDQGQTDESTETKKDSVVTEIDVPSNISEDVEATKFKELIETGNGLLIDVRTPEEYLKSASLLIKKAVKLYLTRFYSYGVFT